MAEANDTLGIIYQNLIDAGCNHETIVICMSLVNQGEIQQLIMILMRYRKDLLHTIHVEKKQIDCLDYLLYQIKKDRI